MTAEVEMLKNEADYTAQCHATALREAAAAASNAQSSRPKDNELESSLKSTIKVLREENKVLKKTISDQRRELELSSARESALVAKFTKLRDAHQQLKLEVSVWYLGINGLFSPDEF